MDEQPDDEQPDDACTPITMTGADGAELTACRHGGHLLGWAPAAGGTPGGQRLWLSPTARCGPGAAIRGGVPVIFPQFAGRGPLPKHGFARDRAWQRLPPDADDEPAGGSDAASWRAGLTDDDGTREIWPHGFALTLAATAAGAELEVRLDVRNTGDDQWSFTAALHTYLAVRDEDASITGVGGRQAEDNAAPPVDGNGPPTVTLGAPGASIPALTTQDVAVPDVAGPVELLDALLGRLVLTAVGFTDRVLWNPGPGHGLADVPAGAEAGFVCVEAARLTPVLLQPGDGWTGLMKLRAEPVAGFTSPD